MGGSALDRTDYLQIICGSGLDWIEFFWIRTGLWQNNFTVHSSLLSAETKIPNN